MKKDPTRLEWFYGTPWHSVAKKVCSNAHMLALGKDEEGLVVVQEFRKSLEQHGEEPATAEFAARLALRKNGLNNFTAMATGIYVDMAKELAQKKDLTPEGRKRVESLLWSANNMEQWTAWAACYKSPGFKFEWPVRMPDEMWVDLNKRAGLANIMLYLAAQELEKESTCGLVAAQGIVRFLKEGMEANERRKRCRNTTMRQ